MVLVNFHVAGEVRMKVGFVRRVESQDKVALQISVIIEVGSGGNHQVKFHASHVGEIGLVCNQERRPKQLFFSMQLWVKIG